MAINRFRTLIRFVTLLVTGEAVVIVPAWNEEQELTIPRYKMTDELIRAAEEFISSQRDTEHPQPFRCHATVDLSVDTAEQLIESLNAWEIDQI